MDERYDMMRTVRDQRYVYVRNYMPHLIYGQHVRYMFVTPTTHLWRKLFDEGKLTPEQSHFWEKKPPEELYDLTNDPDEVHNLAESPDHQQVLERMRKAQQQLAVRVRDVGFLPENEIPSRSEGSSPYEVGHDAKQYPMERIMATAELATSLQPDAVPKLKEALDDGDSAVRYWGAMGFVMRGKAAVEAARRQLIAALGDDAPSVQIAAAWALGQHGKDEDVKKALPVLLSYASYEENGVYLSLMSLTAIDALDARAASALDQLKALPKKVKPQDRRPGYGIEPLIEKILADLEP
jgi:uncharacterized sulfatase